MADESAPKTPRRTSSKAAAAPDDSAPVIPFEQALAELETVVAQMESGDLSLDDSLAAFERGVKLTRQCQQALKTAELKVQSLTEDGTLEALDLEALDDD
jgi:exodeoxyribonuclease VII small subunit